MRKEEPVGRLLDRLELWAALIFCAFLFTAGILRDVAPGLAQKTTGRVFALLDANLRLLFDIGIYTVGGLFVLLIVFTVVESIREAL